MGDAANFFTGANQAATHPGAIPPMTGREFALRMIANSLPAPGQLRVPNTAGGRILGTLGRGVQAGSAIAAEEAARQRLDPLAAQFRLAESMVPAPPDLGPEPGTVQPVSQYAQANQPIGEQNVMGQPTFTPPPPPPGTGMTAEQLVFAANNPLGAELFSPHKQAQTEQARATAELRRKQAQAAGIVEKKLPPGVGQDVATAMRELGLDPTAEASYSPENITRAQGLIQQRREATLSAPVKDALQGAGIDPVAATPRDIAQARQQIFAERVEVAAAQGQQAALLKSTEGLARQRANTRRVVTGINNLQTKIQQNPAVLGAPGAMSRAITSLSDQAMAFAGLVIPGADFRALSNIENYANIFRETGVTSSQLQSQLLGVAIATAAAEGFSGREVTDRKIQLNLQRLAGAVGGGSAEAAFETLEQFKREISDGYETAVSAVRRTDDLTTPILGPNDRRTFTPQRETAPAARSAEGARATQGAQATHRFNPATGQIEPVKPVR